MENNTIAKRYAKALFDLVYAESAKNDVFIKTLDLLKDLSNEIQSNTSLKNVLFNPSYGIEEKKRILRALIDYQAKEAVSSNQANFLKNFVSMLIKKSRLVYLPDIAEEIERLKAGLSKTTPVLMTVPLNLSDEQKNAFGETFEKMLIQKIQLTVKVSPDLLGGMTLQIGSKVFDASLQMKLSHLRNNLMGQ
ncbi:MAG: ATP synthase F1 subunit delta [Nitrospiria bacterium]